MGDKQAHHTIHKLYLTLQACILEAAEKICECRIVQHYHETL